MKLHQYKKQSVELSAADEKMQCKRRVSSGKKKNNCRRFKDLRELSVLTKTSTL